MKNEREPKTNPRDHNDPLSKDVSNTAQNPDAVKDPLEQQLEKSRHMNTPEQNEKLEDIKRRNRQEK